MRPLTEFLITIFRLDPLTSCVFVVCRSYVTPFRHYWIRQTTHPWAGKFATSAVSKELCPALYCPLCFQTNYLVSFQPVMPQQIWIHSELSTLYFQCMKNGKIHLWLLKTFDTLWIRHYCKRQESLKGAFLTTEPNPLDLSFMNNRNSTTLKNPNFLYVCNMNSYFATV